MKTRLQSNKCDACGFIGAVADANDHDHGPVRFCYACGADQLLTRFSLEDTTAILDIVTRGLVPYPSLWRARTHYARVCHERQWGGHKARLAWAVLEALLKDDIDNDIPF